MSFIYVPSSNIPGGAAGEVLYQSAVGVTSFTAVGTAGQVLTSQGSGAPTWAALGGNIKSDLSKYDATFTASTSIGTSFYGSISVALTATTELLIVWGQASAHAVVWNNTTRTFGTPTLLRTVAFTTAKDITAIAVSATSVLVCSCPDGSTSLQTVVLSISGSTITVNTAVNTTLAGSFTGITSGSNNAKALQLVGTSYVFSYLNTTAAQPCFVAITVSGTTPTLGTELTFAAANTAIGLGPTFLSIVYSSTIMVSICTDGLGSLYVNPISVSGTTLTLGTGTTASSNLGGGCVAGLLTTGRIACINRFSGGTQGSIISVSGTTASISSVNMNCPGNQPSIQIIGTKAIITSANFSVTQAINVLTDNSGTAVAGTALTNSFATSGMTLIGADATKVWLSAVVSTFIYYFIYSISGNNPVLSSYIPPSTTSNSAATYVNLAFSSFTTQGYADATNNSTNLITSTYKICPYNTNTNVVIESFDGISPPANQSAVSFVATSNTRSALDLYSGWLFGWNSGLPSNVFARRVELA